MSAYKKTNRDVWRWVIIVMSGIALQILFVIFMSREKQPEVWVILASFVLLYGGIAVAAGMEKKSQRRRMGEICRLLEADEFTAETPPIPERATNVFAPISFLERDLYLRHGAVPIQWFALKPPGICFFEHEFVSGSGKFSTIHTRTVQVYHWGNEQLPGAQLGCEPWFSTHRPKLIGETRQLMQLGERIKTGDIAFDKRWVSVGSQETAARFLTDARRRLMRNSPGGESWVIGNGYVCCAYQGRLSPKMLKRMMEHAQEVLRCVG